MKAKTWKDADGDRVISANVGDMTVFATEQISGRWTLNFGLTNEISGSSWMDTMTGRGAFSTIRFLRPAIEVVARQVEASGSDWFVACDARRARLYSRYIPKNRIEVTS